MKIKKADFAGSWYPSTADECERNIESYLDSSIINSLPEREYQAGISPHAGWYFSGKIACNVIKLLASGGMPDLIVVFGKHLHSGAQASILIDGSWETPFGNLTIAGNLSMELSEQLSIKKERIESFIPDNTIELQLPFIKYFFENTKIVVIGAPPNGYSVELGQKVVQIAKQMDLKIKIIGSTDMTHYGDNFGYTPAGSGSDAVEWVTAVNDKKMIDSMIAMDTREILRQARENSSVCCGGAVAATVAAAKTLGSEKGELLAYSTSYELSSGDSFVGYAGIIY